MVTCAIDLGKFNSVCCFFDSATQKYQFETIATKRSHIEHLLASRPDIDLLVMEACGPSGWINDICLEKQVNTFVCSTNEEAWSWKAIKRKTDRDDALRLAKMAAAEARHTKHAGASSWLDEVQQAMRDGLQPETHGQDNLWSLAMLDAAKQSAHTGHAVSIAEVLTTAGMEPTAMAQDREAAL